LIDAAGAGKPILGICNGCQILAESGLLPNTKGRHEVELGMGHNLRNQKPYGFVCDWVYVKPQFPEKSLFFKYFKESDVLPIPINHGEGRFVLPDDILKASECHAQFLFCDASGNVVENAPINPNGSMNNLAGLCNASGSVLAMMPHPERATFLRQIPLSIQSPWADKKREAFASGQDGAGPWQLVFAAMYDSVKVCVS
jgi:phosphoribosylformylglycinamidine synthase